MEYLARCCESGLSEDVEACDVDGGEEEGNRPKGSGDSGMVGEVAEDGFRNAGSISGNVGSCSPLLAFDSSISLLCNVGNDCLYGDTGKGFARPLGESLGGARKLSGPKDESALTSCCFGEEYGTVGQAAFG